MNLGWTNQEKRVKTWRKQVVAANMASEDQPAFRKPVLNHFQGPKLSVMELAALYDLRYEKGRVG